MPEKLNPLTGGKGASATTCLNHEANVSFRSRIIKRFHSVRMFLDSPQSTVIAWQIVALILMVRVYQLQAFINALVGRVTP